MLVGVARKSASVSHKIWEATIGGFFHLKQMLSLDSGVDSSWISGSTGGSSLGQRDYK